MCMRAGHIAGCTPLATIEFFTAYNLDVSSEIGHSSMVGNIVLSLSFAVVSLLVCHINDWDHPRFIDRAHFGAFVVRNTSKLFYQIRTSKDTVRTDMHRGPSHSIEWCILVSVLAGLALSLPFQMQSFFLWWYAIAVFVGLSSHVFVDACTPSGVPLSAICNYLRYGEVWRRHAFTWYAPWWDITATVPVFWFDWTFHPLRWVRVIKPMCVNDRHPGCKPGLFKTDQGGEYVFKKFAYVTSAVMILGFTGALMPLLTALLPGGTL